MKHLRQLYLNGAAINDTAMESVVELRNLILLDITGSAVTDDG